MSFIRFILKCAVPYPKITSFQRYLFVGPHPDDIEIGAGATIAKLAALGKQITFLICLDGRYGNMHLTEASEEEVVAIRKQEAIRSASQLGVTDVRFLNLSDGGFYSEQQLIEGLAKVIGEVQPEVLFCPDSSSSSECHIDHINVGNACRHIAYFSSFPNIMAKYGTSAAPLRAIAFYMTANPTGFCSTRNHFLKQKQAVLCHESQYPANDSDTNALFTYLNLRSLAYGFRHLSGRAEGFRILSFTQMHCLPEFSEKT